MFEYYSRAYIRSIGWKNTSTLHDVWGRPDGHFLEYADIVARIF
jgi:hypothetical protein